MKFEGFDGAAEDLCLRYFDDQLGGRFREFEEQLGFGDEAWLDDEQVEFQAEGLSEDFPGAGDVVTEECRESG